MNEYQKEADELLWGLLQARKEAVRVLSFADVALMLDERARGLEEAGLHDEATLVRRALRDLTTQTARPTPALAPPSANGNTEPFPPLPAPPPRRGRPPRGGTPADPARAPTAANAPDVTGWPGSSAGNASSPGNA